MDAIANTLSLRFGSDVRFGPDEITFTSSEAASVSRGIEDVRIDTSPIDSKPDKTEHTYDFGTHMVSAHCGGYVNDDDSCSVCEYEWDKWEWYHIISQQNYGWTDAYLCGDCILEMQATLKDFTEENIDDVLGEKL